MDPLHSPVMRTIQSPMQLLLLVVNTGDGGVLSGLRKAAVGLNSERDGAESGSNVGVSGPHLVNKNYFYFSPICLQVASPLPK